MSGRCQWPRFWYVHCNSSLSCWPPSCALSRCCKINSFTIATFDSEREGVVMMLSAVSLIVKCSWCTQFVVGNHPVQAFEQLPVLTSDWREPRLRSAWIEVLEAAGKVFWCRCNGTGEMTGDDAIEVKVGNLCHPVPDRIGSPCIRKSP